jgi:hypothetical protein
MSALRKIRSVIQSPIKVPHLNGASPMKHLQGSIAGVKVFLFNNTISEMTL